MVLNATKATRASLVIGAVMAAVSCGPVAAGSGSIDAQVWGEDFVTQGIPASEFADGWGVQFTKFLVHVSGVRFAATGGPSYELPGPGRVWDLKLATTPISLGMIPRVEARRLDRVQFELSATAMESLAGNASEADVAVMRTGRYAMYVEGTATHPTRGMRSFRWGFSGSTRFTGCQDDARMPGLVVTSGSAPTRAQVTVHADHLFYDGLQNPDARLRFDAIAAADRDGNGAVTLEELAMVDLTSLPTGQYQTGSARGVNTLRDFVTALTTTVGHWNGEGHCDETRF
jgi:hypothetical protein